MKLKKALLHVVVLSLFTTVEILATTNVTPMISTDGELAIAINNLGEVFVWGCNCSGEMALGYQSPSATNFLPNGSYDPVKIKELEDIVYVDTNEAAAVAVDISGNTYTWGWNTDDRLGYPGHIEAVCKPKQVMGLPVIKKAELGDSHTLFLGEDGTVWVSGSNTYGLLGQGTTTKTSYLPIQVKGLSNVKDIAAGGFNGYGNYALALKEDGTVWGWGENIRNILGKDIEEAVTIPKQLDNLANVCKIDTYLESAVFLKEDGTVWLLSGFPSRFFTSSYPSILEPIQLEIEGVLDVAIGKGSILALKEDGTVWECGTNSEYHRFINKTIEKERSGMIEYNYDSYLKFHKLDYLNDIVQISSGNSGTNLALDKDGNIHAWGNPGDELYGDDLDWRNNIDYYFNNFIPPYKIKQLNLRAMIP